MLINVVKENAEYILLEFLEQEHYESVCRSFLLCNFSKTTITAPEQNLLIQELKHTVADKECTLYYCNDGDFFIRWNGAAKKVIAEIELCITRLCRQQEINIPPDFFQYFDLAAHAEDLRMACIDKITQIKEKKDKEFKANNKKTIPEELYEQSASTEFSTKQVETLQINFAKRKRRNVPLVLIVEDQKVSSKLIENVLQSKYKCEIAENGAQAIVKYATHAPDITLLDVELPDINGHILAQKLRNVDPSSFIVMVTGNNYLKDVREAKNNKVNGFIMKPFTKDKLLDSVNRFNSI